MTDHRTVPLALAWILCFGSAGCGQQEPKEPKEVREAVDLGPRPEDPQDGPVRAWDSEEELLRFVYQSKKGEGYKPYDHRVDRGARPMLPGELAPVSIQVHADREGDRYLPINDEVNVWKAYAFFHPRNALNQRMGDGFLTRIAPWWRWARMPAALGGNHTPGIAADCDGRKHTPAHDIDPSWECGSPDGKPGVAAWFEPVKVKPDGSYSYDFTNMKACMLEVLRSGLLPHLNISSAHAVFTGRITSMKWYHWNEEPVSDLDAWGGFVEAAMRAMDNPSLPLWRFSIVNEPNCLRRENQTLYKVGYRGGPSQYAAQYMATARAIRKVVPGARFQVGNYVISDHSPTEMNLHRYLIALRDALRADADLSWADSTFYSVSVYDVPHKTIYGAEESKFEVLERYREAVGLKALPIKVDEYDIHPDVFGPYDRSHARPFFYNWQSASWLAKTFEVFRQHRVRSAAGWADQVFHKTPNLWLPTPRYYVFLMDALLSGTVELQQESDLYPLLARLDEADAATHRYRLPVEGGLSPAYSGEGYSYRSVEAVSSRSADRRSVRAMLYYDTTILLSDEETERSKDVVEVDFRISGLEAGRWRVRSYGIGPHVEGNGPEDAWIRWEEQHQRTRPFRPLHVGEFEVPAGGAAVRLHPGGGGDGFAFPRHAVLFFDLQRVD